MKHKDRGETLSKEGCGRVVVNKTLGVVCSYTIESSIFPSSYTNFIHKTSKSEEKNKDFALCSEEERFELIKGGESKENIIIVENKELGRMLMTSVLDVIEKNPFSRLKEGSIGRYTKEVSGKLLQNE